MNIKLLTSEDWEKYKAIRLAALTTDPQAFGSNLVEEIKREEPEWRIRLESPNRFFFAVEEEGELKSLAGGFKDKEDKWSVIAVHTLPEARGKGYAQALVKKVIEEAGKRGATSIYLVVNCDQAEAVYVYKKLGFEIAETLKNQKLGDGKLHDQYLMKKDLA